MNVEPAKVDAIFSEWEKPGSPGCALVVIKNQEIIYKRGYGSANLEYDIPITTTAVFDIASTSKQFTALCILLLAKQKQLSLDDDVQTHVPELGQYNQPITIRHLIHHTSGIRDYLTLMHLSGMRFENDYPIEEIIELICRQKDLNFESGTEFLYSNSGYLLMATIVKRVSGKSIRDFAHESIFAPLGMKNTHFHDDFAEIVKNRATGYSKIDGDRYKIDMTLFDVMGDGGVYTTAEDLFLWDQNFYHNIVGGYGNELITEMATPGNLNNGSLLDYAFGLIISEYKGFRTVSHSGSWMGYRSEFIRFPDERISVICLANDGDINPTELAKKVADLYLPLDSETYQGEVANQHGIKTVNLPISDLEKKTGLYQNKEGEKIWEILLDDGKLFAEVEGLKFQIVPTGQQTFQALDYKFPMTIEFEQQGEKGIPNMHVSLEGGSLKIYSRIKLDQAEGIDLQEYVASYHSMELNCSYRFKLKDEKLLLERKGAMAELLKLIKKDFFKGQFISFRFTRNEHLEIDGFFLDAGRVTNLRFNKLNSS